MLYMAATASTTSMTAFQHCVVLREKQHDNTVHCYSYPNKVCSLTQVQMLPVHLWHGHQRLGTA